MSFWDDTEPMAASTGGGFWDNSTPAAEEQPDTKPISGSHRRKTECTELSARYLYRRGFSESRLLEAMKLERLERGQSWHFITAGDVDSLSFLKVVLLHQPRLQYLLVSTWCMAAEDILQLREWIGGGIIEKMDCYVGEIFPNSYRVEWQMLNKLVDETQCGRVTVFRNHSKIYAGYGDDWHFAIETSANINTNPRTEQGVITIDEGLYNFYKEYFDGIVSFEK